VKIRVLSVGKDKGPTAELAEEYAGRIRRSAELTLLELRAEGPEREAGTLLGKIRGELWVLDERGTLLGSTQLSQRLEKLRDTAQELTLCIGGDEGLARVIVLEQLYRAFEILRGAPYHK